MTYGARNRKTSIRARIITRSVSRITSRIPNALIAPPKLKRFTVRTNIKLVYSSYNIKGSAHSDML